MEKPEVNVNLGRPFRPVRPRPAAERRGRRAAFRQRKRAGSIQTLDLRDRLSWRGMESRAIWNLSESGIVPERRISLFLDGGEYANAC